MTQQPVEANVVLTSDNTQYDQSMTASSAKTDHLANSVDNLTTKINNLAKSAGRKLIGAGAFDTAGIVAATAAYGAWENQMAGLNAQAAVLNKTISGQRATFNSYANDVNQIRRTYGETTQGAVQLVTTLSKLNDQTTTVDQLANSFEKLGQTTGEVPAILAQSMLQLQRTMGTSQRDTEQYSNQLAVLQSRSNASAESILEFSNSIAPVGRLLNMSQTDIMGFSNAFIKAGQDGYQASNVFQKMVTDIAAATQSGSPDLAKYANLVGMTVGQFKDLSGTQKIMDIFDAINRQGPAAITTLNRMGLDGQRTVRTITAMASQPGGIASEIRAAQGATGQETSRGSTAAMDTLVHSLSMLRAEINQTAEAFGKTFAPAAEVGIRVLTALASGARALMDSPFGKMAGIVAGIAAPFLMLAGAVLTASKAIAAFSAINLVTRGALVSGFMRQRALTATGGGAAAMSEGELARGSFIGRGMFNMGAGTARLFGAGSGEGPGMVSRATGYGLTAAGAGARMYGQAMYAGGAYNDWTRRPSLTGSSLFGRFFAPRTGEEEAQRPGESGFAYRRRTSTGAGAQAAQEAESARRAAGALDDVAKKSMSAGEGLGKLSRGFGETARLMAMSAGNGLRTTGGALGRVGSSAFAGLFGSNPWMLGLTAGMIGIPLIASLMGHKTPTYQYKDTSGTTTPYLQAGGVQLPAVSTPLGSSMTSANTVGRATTITGSDIAAAGDSAYHRTASPTQGMTIAQAITRLSPTYRTVASNPTALNSMKLDLINQFGPSGAQQVLNALGSGGGYNPSSLMSMTNTGMLNNLGGTFSNASGLAFSTGGINGFRTTQGQQIQQTLGFYGSGVNATMINGPSAVPGESSRLPDRLKGTRIAVNKFMAKQYFGLTLDDDTASKIQMSSDMGTYFASLMSNLSSTDQDAVLSSAGLNTALSGGQAVKALVGAFTNPAANPQNRSSAQYRMQQLAGGGLFFSNTVQTAVAQTSNQNAQYKAVQSIVQGLANMPTGKALSSLSGIRAVIGDDTDPNSVLALGAQGQIQQNLAYRMPYMNRTQQFGAQAEVYQSAMTAPMTPTGMAERQQAQQTFAQQVQSQYSYFQGLLYQQREYDVSRSRAEQDYNLQRSYAQEDFQRTRMREETDFNIQRTREENDFSRTMGRNRADYNLSRTREEKDHQHQVMLMIDQQAQSMYNMYERVKVQRTDSASFLLVNSQDQLQRMRQQSQNLDQLRSMGLSKDAIQQMGLTSTDNAQQLARFVSEVAQDPSLIKQFNEAVSKRLKAAGALVTDKSSSDWREFQRSYNLSRDRAQEDFQKSVRRAHEDFQRTMGQQDTDFQRSLDRQSQDFGVSMNRMENQFNTSMTRSAEDLARSAETIDGSFANILTQATQKLGGHAQKQAQIVLNQFKGLKQATSPYAVDLMQSLADIFGVTYKPPKDWQTVNSNLAPHSHAGQHNQNNPDLARATGGVLPGYSPGVDNMSFKAANGAVLNLSGGEAIMRPEWVKAVGGEGAVNDMNRRATRGFASGGVFRPINTAVSRGIHDQWTGYAAVDFSTPVGTPVYAVTGGTISQSRDIAGPLPSDQYHNPAYGPYGSYGRVMYLRTDMGPEVVYGHLSQRGLVAGTHVRGGQPIALSGSSGNSSGPHLHFGDSDGNPYEFITGALYSHGSIRANVNGDSVVGLSSHPGMGGSLASILRSWYPKAEAAAGSMSAINPFNPGQVSGILNSFATKAYHKWYKDGSIFNSPQMIGVGENGPEMVLPLNTHGADFIGDIMKKSSTGNAARVLNSYGSTPMHNVFNSYQIDRSTNFTGPITVQANNPLEFLQLLQRRQALGALKNPALGGRRL
jgi:TP901 family phage tail tape measure protein